MMLPPRGADAERFRYAGTFPAHPKVLKTVFLVRPILSGLVILDPHAQSITPGCKMGQVNEMLGFPNRSSGAHPGRHFSVQWKDTPELPPCERKLLRFFHAVTTHSGHRT
jgi:hypothetical protein